MRIGDLNGDSPSRSAGSIFVSSRGYTSISHVVGLAAFKRIHVAFVSHNPGDIFFLFSLIIDAREFPRYKEGSLVSSKRSKPHFLLFNTREFLCIFLLPHKGKEEMGAALREINKKMMNYFDLTKCRDIWKGQKQIESEGFRTVLRAE
jgi:hypothetical protein